MNINDAFPSKYLKSSDLQGNIVTVKIREVAVEEIGTDRKMILHFVNKERGMVLNRTNARTIGEAYGDDTDDWIGKPIEVFSMKVDFQGRMVDGLRVRVPRQQPAARQPTQVGNASVTVPAGGFVERPAPAGGPAPLDDEIPFFPEWR